MDGRGGFPPAIPGPNGGAEDAQAQRKKGGRGGEGIRLFGHRCRLRDERNLDRRGEGHNTDKQEVSEVPEAAAE